MKGWATDLKTVSEDMINRRVERTGDGTHKHAIKSKADNNNNEMKKHEIDHSGLWGWGKKSSCCLYWTMFKSRNFWFLDDKEMTAEDRKYVKILYKCYD